MIRAPRGASEQDGFAAIALLLLGAMAAVALLLAHRDLAAIARGHAQARSIAVLAEARMALAGYALSYPERHPGQGYGYLPCPDGDNDGSPAGACGARGLGAIGRLPYRTLGLGDLHDGWGECLWYAVADSVKNNPKPLVLNWDSAGQFDVVAASGVRLTLDDSPPARAVGVVLAPGGALPMQQRPYLPGSRCSGSTSADTDLAGYLDAAYPAKPSGVHSVQQGTTDSVANNDLLSWLTVDDIFDALRRRSDFAAFIDTVIDRAAAALATASHQHDFVAVHADTQLGTMAGGALPTAAALGLTDAAADAHDNWRNQFRFLLCIGGEACIAAELSESATAPNETMIEHCRLALIFGGERIRSQPGRQTRATVADRADHRNYFEGPNPAVLASGEGLLAGHRHFAIAEPARPAHEDVIRCLP
ncbi:hypothetical protein [Azoarcus sp. DD4]|uniref:hypothetical protein n=1 Tax=Azoarcus sp. DD4 TaxID=2027405 RepID=UPI00197AA9D2|nr:hypothetical protein [Azoarcus sp. DD4]